MHIYQLRNKVTGKSYIGKAADYLLRFERHIKNCKKGVNRRLYDSMRCHGVEAFETLLLEVTTDEQSDSRERYWIQKLDTLMPKGYNMTIGGGGGDTLSTWPEDAKARLYKQQALKRLGRNHTATAKLKMSIAAKEREATRTEEQKRSKSEKLSATKRVQGDPPHLRAYRATNPLPAFTGKNHTLQSKEKISQARKGKSYEDIFGCEEAVRLKELRKGQFTGVNNPRYVEFSLETKKAVVAYLLSNLSIPFSSIGPYVGKSDFLIRKFLHSNGIRNYQSYLRLSDTEKINILGAINVD